MNRSIVPDRSWSLFLDRDGVLNKRLINDYVKSPGEFQWNEAALECLKYFSGRFGVIVVVTNQQGIGKGLMTKGQLDNIHAKMIADVESSGGRIDKVYFCPDLENSGSFCRKPAVGMGLRARKDFPEINFRKSVMVGDTLTDMIFGKRLKMKTVLITPDSELPRRHPEMVDLWFETMADLLKFFKNANEVV